jgi:pilus assembly protein CpaC
MHRTMSILRKLSWSVFAGLALHTAAPSGFAQADAFLQPNKDAPPPAIQGGGVVVPIEGKDGGKIIVSVINLTKTVGMTRAPGATEDPIIEKVQNENPRVIRVQSIFNDPRHVLITGLTAGTSKVTFTGYTDAAMKDRHDEVFEVRVVSDDALMREQLRKDFLALVKKTVPTANIDATVVFSTTAGPVTISTTSANNAPDSVNRTGVSQDRMVVFLTGNVLTAENVNGILESARAMFGATANIVNQMTIGGVQQVEVDCTICSVKRTKLRQMSFSWSINRPDFFLSSILPGSSGSFTNTVVSGIGAVTANQVNSGGNVIFGSVNNSGAFFGFLQALRTDGLAKFQAEPKVVTLSGRPAQFLSGGTVPTISTSLTGSTVTQVPFGTTITVLPIVLGNGKIHLEVAPQISTPDPTLSVSTAGGNNAPGFRSQGAQVAVQLEDGQTIAIGGLISHKNEGTIVKVPVLGDIPFVGAAFRSVRYNEEEEELIILVTPRLIDPMGCNQLPDRLPTRLTRSPDDFELYLEGLLELPRGQRQICGPNGCYQAPHNLGPTAGAFPCGDQGSCGPTGGYRGHSGAACGPNGCRTPNGPACASGACSANGAPLGVTPRMAMPMPSSLPFTAEKSRTMADPNVSYAPQEAPPSYVAPAGYSPVPQDAPVAGPALRLPAGSPE